MITDTLPIVTSVANLIEQLECCKSLSGGSIPLMASFPDAKVHLTAKIELEITAKLEELERRIYTLKEKQEMVNKHYESSASLLQKYSSALDFRILTVATPTVPPLAKMIEWLEEINILLNNQYLCKLHLLKTALTDEGVGSQHFVHMWQEGGDVMLSTLKDRLTRVELFLAEKR
ncbi:hypothetical protein V1264_000652 [Littorina saxatilis]